MGRFHFRGRLFSDSELRDFSSCGSFWWTVEGGRMFLWVEKCNSAMAGFLAYGKRVRVLCPGRRDGEWISGFGWLKMVCEKALRSR